MIVLAIGDVVGDPGVEILSRRLRQLKRHTGADLTVVNGENAAGGRGITPALAEEIFDAGADVITLGNHTFANRQICDYLDERRHILRPLNYPPQQPGTGYTLIECGGKQVCVFLMQGRVGMDYNVSSPFAAADRLLAEVKATCIWPRSMPRPPRKSRPWLIISTDAAPPFGARTPTSPPPTPASFRGAPDTSPIWA